jgi:hypothetical protein
MPSQKTICQQCGDFIPTDEMPGHTRWHADAALFQQAMKNILGRDVAAPPTAALADLHDEPRFDVALRNVLTAHDGPFSMEDVFVAGDAGFSMEAACEPDCSCVFTADGQVTTPCVEMRAAMYADAGSLLAPAEQTYMARGDAIAELLDAVSSGATLEVQGPKLDDSTVKAWIESATGARHAEATGQAIGPVLVALARDWKAASTIPAPCAPQPKLEVLLRTTPTMVEPCCYGFLQREERDRLVHLRDEWSTLVQRPFRGQWLWLFGSADARLISLLIANEEQLVPSGDDGVSFGSMQRGYSAEEFLSLVDTHGTEQFFGARVHPALCADNGAARIYLPAVSVEAQLKFRYTGDVRGVVLVGEQLT